MRRETSEQSSKRLPPGAVSGYRDAARESGIVTSMGVAERVLDRYLDPLTDALSPEVARKLLELRPNPEDAARVAELGAKADAGALTDAERDEYRTLADVGTLVAILKAKARRVLTRTAD
jgi:hypothetical protein